MSLPGETRISDFYGRPNHWGSVVRAIPGDFTCMTTIGQGSTAKVAGACDDGTVRIYDSVAGVLRLSIRPGLPIQEVTGIPGGSLLVCTHSGHPTITLWDIQTGGLVQTFILNGEVKRTTVSLNGRYLACETSGNTIDVWEMASGTRNFDPLETFKGNTPCWLAPEELIMVVDGASGYVWNVAAKGCPVYKFRAIPQVYSAAYSQVFDQLATLAGHAATDGSQYLTIHDLKTRTSSTLTFSSGNRLSSITFSQTTRQLVCGGEGPGLETVTISTGLRTYFYFPATVTSISTLSTGTAVVNLQGSGIQLMRLDQERAPPRQPTPPALAAYPLDNGRIMTVVLTTYDHIILLETANMSHVFSVPTWEDPSVATNSTVFLCASLQNKIAVCRFEKGAEAYLQMWEFSHQRPRWTIRANGCPSAVSISPACTRLVAFHSKDRKIPAYNRNLESLFPDLHRKSSVFDPSRRGHVFNPRWGDRFFNPSQGSGVIDWYLGSPIYVLDAYDGTLLAQTIVGNPEASPPLDITLDSEDRFYLHDDTHREPYDINAVSQIGHPTTHSITRCAKQRLDGQVLEKRYSWDDGREWVICGSRRICWVPPVYIGSSQYWVGPSLVIVGRDGALRKLTFSESSSSL